MFVLQFTIDYKSNLRDCLAKKFGINKTSVNTSHIKWAGISMNDENNICTAGSTSYFPEVKILFLSNLVYFLNEFQSNKKLEKRKVNDQLQSFFFLSLKLLFFSTTVL